MYQIVVMEPSWKFHEKSIHPFYCNIAHRDGAAPRWETVKQSSQVWNSLDNYFLCRAWHIMKISWKSVHPFLHNIVNKHGSRKWKNRSRIEGVYHKMFKIVHCLISNLSWKFHENLFIRFSIMLLTDRDFIEKKYIKRNLVCKALNIAVPKFSNSLLPNISWKFYENPPMHFPQCC